MKCSTCKHYDKFGGTTKLGIELELGRCRKAVQFWNVTEWSRDDDIGRTLKAEYKDNKMFVQDGSDYAAWLYTTPDFFCAHYTDKQVTHE